MHLALEVQEILLNIFACCRPSPPSRRTVTPDLLALAQTCRAFKEPALDVLWKQLDDLSPIVRCLPEASRALLTAETDVEGPQGSFPGNKRYLFTRPPTPEEWVTLRSYTRRIWSIEEDFKCTLDEESFRILSNPPSTSDAPLFPNLRHLRFQYTTEAIPLLHLPLPSLVSLDLVFGDLSIFRICLGSEFPEFSPDMRRLSVRVRNLGDTFIKIEPGYICRWRNLQTVVCPQIDLDADVLAHLSRMSALTRLTFKLTAVLPDTDSSLLFSDLHDLTLHSGSLYPISRFLTRVRLPALADLTVIISGRPSKIELSSFVASILTSNASHIIQALTLNQLSPSISAVRSLDGISLDLEDLQPCIAFRNLRRLNLNIGWNVCLTDHAVLALASAWPRLEHLVINMYPGWNASQAGCGVTPNGLLKLLETCPSLRWVALVLDTRGRAAAPPPPLPPPGLMAIPGRTWSLPRALTIDVLDSRIDAESVPAVADFFAALVPWSNVTFSAWRGGKMVKPDGWEAYKVRWDDVFRLACRRSVFSSDCPVSVSLHGSSESYHPDRKNSNRRAAVICEWTRMRVR